MLHTYEKFENKTWVRISYDRPIGKCVCMHAGSYCSWVMAIYSTECIKRFNISLNLHFYFVIIESNFYSKIIAGSNNSSNKIKKSNLSPLLSFPWCLVNLWYHNLNIDMVQKSSFTSWISCYILIIRLILF